MEETSFAKKAPKDFYNTLDKISETVKKGGFENVKIPNLKGSESS